jgi:hypothetical protein
MHRFRENPIEIIDYGSGVFRRGIASVNAIFNAVFRTMFGTILRAMFEVARISAEL